ncbi:MAG TPA: NTP transferase domain-containing protein [Spirochaetia bacterium]|nr:NTP transferase domain-containing protein [Spirochaetia bacterium]
MDKPDMTALILAAGYSSRMGKFKPLLKLGPLTAAAHAVRCFQRAGIQDVRVVAGYRAAEVASAVEPLGARVVFNPRFDQGMFSSVQAGVGSLEPGVGAFFLLPVDHPLVRPFTVSKILAARRSCPKGIVYPVCRGRRGHPPLVSCRYREEILAGFCQGGLQSLLGRYEQDSLDVAVPDEGVLLDMDTREDYLSLLGVLTSQAIPTSGECRRIFEEVRTAEGVWQHCLAVADLAAMLAAILNEAGACLDEDLVAAGALLHDVARCRPDHARDGAAILQGLGYPRVAKIVAVHMDLEASEENPLSEAELVFLADKMVSGQSVVSLTDRLRHLLERLGDDGRARAVHRMEQAGLIKKKVETILGRPLETFLAEGSAVS